MKILVDENMPYARELFSRLGEVKAVAGRPVPVEALNDADALMVRSVTKVNEALLSGKAIKFVGTATAGTDHVDQAWLQQAGIGFSAAPGCNAIAVVEYVFSALLMLAERDGFALADRTVGIVGVGNVGGRLQKRLEALGIKTLLCDPPRADRGDEGDFRSLDELVQDADILTFHTPLYKEGQYKTLHLADEALIRRLKPGTILINACRGPVVDNAALLQRLQADFDNYRRRNASIAADSLDEGERNLIKALLPVLDNFDRALAAVPEDEKTAWVDGMKLVSKQLYETLYKAGLEEIQAEGQFDPELHDAVMQEENEDKESGEIIDVFQKGYKVKNRIIRHSMVKVAK